MVTVLRQDGLRVVIYLDDHDPPHVHVYLGAAEAKIGLEPIAGRPPLLRASAMRLGELRKALRIVAGNLPALRARWEEIHG